MADFHPRCPKCDKVMERGHLPDALDHVSFVLAKWVQGVPKEVSNGSSFVLVRVR